MKQILTWQCDFCFGTGTKAEIEKHEPNCNLNPARRSCFTCKHPNYDYDFCKAGNQDFSMGDGIKNCTKYEELDLSNLLT